MPKRDQRVEASIQEAARLAYPVFRREGWEWWNDPSPDAKALAATFRRLLDDANDANDETSYRGTGRLGVVHVGGQRYTLVLDLGEVDLADA